ncbi:MAG: protein translocase subunit SecD [bacterium]|nr:protein translocase subunit SecD [bacterium]
MNRRSLLILGASLLSIYLLVPTFGQFQQKREQRARDLKPTPWYFKLFPEKQINLGLDLRGGIYIELEVRMEEALANRLDLLSSEMSRIIEEKEILLKTSRQDHPLRLIVDLSSEEAVPKFREFVRHNFSESLLEVEQTGKTVSYKLNDKYKNYLNDMTMRQAVETVRNRIDRYGVSEPTIQRLGGDKIAIELPGVGDPDRAIEIIKKAGRLEFKLVEDSVEASELQGWVSEAREKNRLPDDFSINTVEKINEFLKNKLPKGTEIAFEIQIDPITRKTVGGVPYLLQKKAEVTGEMLRNAQVNVNDNEPYVSLSFNGLGTKLFADLTRDNIKRRLAILLDGNVTKAPVIQSEIPNGEAQITLGFGNYQALIKEAEDLTLVLREGALPARLQELTKTIIGPSLGLDSIRQGVRVTLIGGLIVVFFMLAYYKKEGLFANISLALNMILILALLTLFGATLTLPGIAALVLTIGMAVDANVIIFERIRDELREGQEKKIAVELGYKHAMSAVVDSNLTTLLAGIVLYQFGTGPIRGFAVTLMIGILTTLFTAIYVTRALQDWSLARAHKKSGGFR